MIKNAVKLVTPPIAIKLYHQLKTFYGVAGSYNSWEEAMSAANKYTRGGYSDSKILTQVLNAIQAVREGRAVFERDGVLFDQPDYNYPLLANLYRTMGEIHAQGQEVNVLDFGGSLGSVYFQNRSILKSLEPYKWHIVEQPHFVEAGKKSIPEITFHAKIEDFVKAKYSKDILLYSSVIQYFDRPYEWVKRGLDAGFKYIIIDRTYFNPQTGERIAVQYVPPYIYDAAYPCCLLDKNKLRRFIEKAGYTQLDKWISFDLMPCRLGRLNDMVLPSEGMLFKKI